MARATRPPAMNYGYIYCMCAVLLGPLRQHRPIQRPLVRHRCALSGGTCSHSQVAAAAPRTLLLVPSCPVSNAASARMLHSDSGATSFSYSLLPSTNSPLFLKRLRVSFLVLKKPLKANQIRGNQFPKPEHLLIAASCIDTY